MNNTHLIFCHEKLLYKRFRKPVIVHRDDHISLNCLQNTRHNYNIHSNVTNLFSVPKNYRKPRFVESLKAVMTDDGLVSFECKVVGFPTPTLQWFKDNEELKPGDVYQLTGTSSLGELPTSRCVFTYSIKPIDQCRRSGNRPFGESVCT